MKNWLAVIGFYLMGVASISGQTLHYDVIRNGESMGSTIVKRMRNGNQVTYHLSTKTEFRILFLFKVEYDLQETFENGVLVNGKGYNTLNGSVQKETKMQKKTNGYELIIDGITTEVSERGIKESVSEIYFEEPYDDKPVYSAYFARYMNFDKLGDHQYSLTSPDGTNVYTYENGICTEVKVSRDFASFTFFLKPESLAAVRSKKIIGSND